MVNRILFISFSIIAVVILLCFASYIYTKWRPLKIERSIQINASSSEVWRVLTDTAKYPEWNPFIISSTGDVHVGGRLTNMLRNNGSEMIFKPRILVADRDHELRWIGQFGFPGVVDGEHYFIIEETGSNSVKFIQGEEFTGFLVPVAGSSLDVANGFDAMNKALKERAE